MLSLLYEFVDVYKLMKVSLTAIVTVTLIRAWAYAARDRVEQEERQRDIEESKKEEELKEQIVPISTTIYEENDCSICKKPIWTREGLEIEKQQTVELQCTHCFHFSCLNGKSLSSSGLDDTSYVIVDKVPPRCPLCHFQPEIIEASALHKWQTVRYWVLIIDEALDQLAPSSGKYGVSWASIRSRIRKMSGLTLELLAKGEEQTFGKEGMDSYEDLDGPGKFPYFAALKDGNAERFQDTIDKAYRKGGGKWCSYQSDRGGERMVFKYSWGVPPFTHCHNCDKQIESCGTNMITGKDCHICGDYEINKSYWCSEECYSTHYDDCKKLMDRVERFRITLNLTK